MAKGLVSPTGKPKTLPGVHANQGVEAAYRRRLEALVDEMHRSLLYWLRAAYRANPPEMAQDAPEGGGWVGISASPAMSLREAMRRLARRWQRRFDDAAPELAKYFATAAAERADGALAAILKRAGFSVRFKATAAANDVLQATIGGNVGLIKSIAQQHLSEVEGLVMRSVQAGRDLGSLTKALEERYGITRRRAAFIARDQNNKATSMITRVRQTELGITEADWLHSGAGKHPRPDHVAVSGKRYDIRKGMLINDRWVFPGEDPNCRCVGRPIIPGRS